MGHCSIETIWNIEPTILIKPTPGICLSIMRSAEYPPGGRSAKYTEPSGRLLQ